jgi:hypothetical protein
MAAKPSECGENTSRPQICLNTYSMYTADLQHDGVPVPTTVDNHLPSSIILTLRAIFTRLA